ncbi:hypothetical protein WA026_006223 [Henosepilachna vigintioctopunctata]|uniref:Uncharacterized protein n=1 Tax=Henosepilachna vigintioctopunctata TaxID=420089 RepID=A0AAW1TI16_9CUCU
MIHRKLHHRGTKPNYVPYGQLPPHKEGQRESMHFRVVTSDIVDRVASYRSLSLAARINVNVRKTKCPDDEPTFNIIGNKENVWLSNKAASRGRVRRGKCTRHTKRIKKVPERFY